MNHRTLFSALLLCVVIASAACVSWRYRAGDKLYSKQDNSFYAEIIDTESNHQFSNGMVIDAVKIRPANKGEPEAWMSVEVLEVWYDVKR